MLVARRPVQRPGRDAAARQTDVTGLTHARYDALASAERRLGALLGQESSMLTPKWVTSSVVDCGRCRANGIDGSGVGGLLVVVVAPYLGCAVGYDPDQRGIEHG